MNWTVSQEDILTLRADAAVLPLEITMNIGGSPAARSLAQAGGETLREAVDREKYLPAGSARAIAPCGLPFKHLILASPPRWRTGKANELLVLRRCYEGVFDAVQALGCCSVAMPFLSAAYYRFPLPEAVHIALTEAEKRPLQVVFAAETPAIADQTRQHYRKPRVGAFVGYYRDHALFALDNGLYARVDLRPERSRVDVIPYFEACFRQGTDPLQPPLPEAEIARLRALAEAADI